MHTISAFFKLFHCTHNHMFTSTTTKYGCIHGKDAIEAYRFNLQGGTHDEPMVSPFGFIVFIGASPDGPGAVQGKCPFWARSTTLDHLHSSLNSVSVKETMALCISSITMHIIINASCNSMPHRGSTVIP